MAFNKPTDTALLMLPGGDEVRGTRIADPELISAQGDLAQVAASSAREEALYPTWPPPSGDWNDENLPAAPAQGPGRHTLRGPGGQFTAARATRVPNTPAEASSPKALATTSPRAPIQSPAAPTNTVAPVQLQPSRVQLPGLFIGVVREKMPMIMQDLLGPATVFADWNAFEAAVVDIKKATIVHAQTKEARLVEMAAAAKPVSRNVVTSHLASPPHHLARPQPYVYPPYQRPQGPPPNVYPVPQQQAPAAPRAPPTYRPDSERLVDLERNLPVHHPNTDVGRAAWAQDTSDWHARNGNRGPNELRPFPLTPGTAPLDAQGECFKCALFGHMTAECPNPELPPLEKKWRQIAASIRRGANATRPRNPPAPTPVQPGKWGRAVELELTAHLTAPTHYSAQAVPEFAEARLGDVIAPEFASHQVSRGSVDQQKIQIIKLADLGWRNESIEDIKKRTKFRGGQCASPSRQVHSRLESIPEEQIDQLEMQENQPRSSEWYNRNQRRKRTNEKYAVDVEEGGIAKIEVVEEMLKSGKPDVRDVTRGKELNPPLRQVQNPVDLPIAERNDDPPRPQIARPVTSLGVERRSAEQRASWRAYMGVSKRGIVNPEHTWGASDVNKRASVVGNENFPSREVPPHMPADAKLPDIDGLRSWNRTTIVNEDWRQIWTLDDAAGPSDEHPGVEQPPMPNITDKSILTRKTDPFLSARVDAVLSEIKIGEDLTENQRDRVIEVL
ncbi:hypothetical protein C8R43DRAFT_953670 [Mycena crocata]|nr:hypothetical protein C8R43DRAFT_953670 [Mycena crocata]